MMNSIFKGIVAGALLTLGITVMAAAASPIARLDVGGRGDVKITPVSKPKGGMAENPAWAKQNKDKYICSQSAPLKSGGWEEYELSFIPDRDGMATIYLRGVWFRKKGDKVNTPVWIYWSDVVVEGASLANGDFKKLDGKGVPAGWQVKKENLLSENGGNYVKTCHDIPCMQTIKVKKDQKVTIKAKIKKAE